ncbi:hypothetical protein GCM10009127_22440 [Alteraurantiacibacter aestuarii]|uniref:ketopantoate reductase family protein n=1 Tax=Alteraurantiacibacter aestuarii TaxID=650004 RepID=UPI0031DBBF24
MDPAPLNILVLGASYGLLPGIKLAMAGHVVTFVGRAQEIAQMAAEDLVLHIGDRRSGEMIEMRTGNAAFTTPEQADPSLADMVILAMQEPQCAAPNVADLIRRIAAAGKPCLSIMNLPPPPFLAQLGIGGAALEGVYSSADAWSGFDPSCMSNSSPDPQALRMDPSRPGELSVTLASNFKAAPFARDEDQQLLLRLARDMSRVKVMVDGRMKAPPVRLLAHSSAFIPLAKWPMLIAGNCRCVMPGGMRSIADAVLTDRVRTEQIYDAVSQLVIALGAPEAILVPFSAYASAAQHLVRPSSAARALEGGATQIERIDLLVLQLMRQAGLDSSGVEPIVDLIEERLAANRQQI